MKNDLYVRSRPYDRKHRVHASQHAANVPSIFAVWTARRLQIMFTFLGRTKHLIHSMARYSEIAICIGI